MVDLDIYLAGVCTTTVFGRKQAVVEKPDSSSQDMIPLVLHCRTSNLSLAERDAAIDTLFHPLRLEVDWALVTID